MADANNLTEFDPLAGELIRLRGRVKLQVSYHGGRSPSLVFLHGGLGNRFNWRSQYEFFRDQGKTVLAYDLAGHGQSTPYPRYSLGRHRRDLTRLLKYYHIQRPILCCHSYGVPLGLEWARKHRVSGLVLVAGGTHNLTPWWEIPLMKFLAWGGRYLYHLPGVQYLTNRLSSNQQTQLEQFFAESPVPTESHPYEALEIFWGYDFWQRRGHSKLKVPVLIISGGDDPMFTEAMGAELAAYFDFGQHLHLPQGGHLLIAEYPEVVNGAISEFINQIETHPMTNQTKLGLG